MLRQTLSPCLQASSQFLRRLATASLDISKAHPELFNGISTKYGWVLVRKTHVAKRWTQNELNKELDEKIGRSKDAHDLLSVQKLVDDWMMNTDLKAMPVTKKKSQAKVHSENSMKLFLQQARYVEGSGVVATKEEAKIQEKTYKSISGDAVTFTNAWNYFVTISYADYTHLPHKEARQELGIAWRELSIDDKERYRHDYANLLKSGKDIMAGKIVDREVKLKRAKKLWEAKERKRLRELGMKPSGEQ